ncbi:NADH:ubiquinone oxidoreductase [Pseudoneurospora amorphoporcata]|uniref:NADH dehydrogenase [ubiquinone] 1 alpha subcomplex subunit 1 n=1 Tax=Pseudoneurospora amorphoporcata TaxID=241081 RepID=A0AAN6P720_9PEZI|nr:NADH:ubiquinone oxidoreductase [Pseudoneurospora amorphoporcata]
MPVPFEALIPYAIIVTMFGVTGAGLSAIKTAQNGGKKARWSLDTWDRYEPLIPANYTMMDRDRRLTGWLRGQTDAADAPYGFEYNNPWRVEKRFS